MHVALRDHRHLRRRYRQAVPIRERIVHIRRIRVLHRPHLHLPEAHPGAFVESRYATRQSATPVVTAIATCWIVANAHHLGGSWRRTSALRCGGARDGNLGVGVHREGHHAVDIAGCQARIVERIQHGLGSEPQLTATRVLGEVSGADAHDRRLTGQHSCRCYRAQFAGVALSGETLRADIWNDNHKAVATIIAPSRDDTVCLGSRWPRPDHPAPSGPQTLPVEGIRSRPEYRARYLASCPARRARRKRPVTRRSRALLPFSTFAITRRRPSRQGKSS